MKHYNLKISERQAEILIKALNVYSRLGIGQISDAVASLPLQSPFMRGLNDTKDKIRELLRPYLKSNTFGILHEDVRPEPKIAFDMYQVINHRLSWDRAIAAGLVPNRNSPLDLTKMFSRDYDTPHSAFQEEPLAGISGNNEHSKLLSAAKTLLDDALDREECIDEDTGNMYDDWQALSDAIDDLETKGDM